MRLQCTTLLIESWCKKKTSLTDHFRYDVNITETVQTLCKSYTFIAYITFSYNSGSLPSDWRTGSIVAVHKTGNKNDPANYRPISLTCVICKIMESIIRDSIIHYFFANRFFSDKQYGFIEGRSTTLQLLRIMDEWTELLDSGGQIDVIYTDLLKHLIKSLIKDCLLN